MTFKEYNDLLRLLQKIQSLPSLCIFERQEDPMSADYNALFQTLNSLKNLKSLKIILGSYRFRGEEMKAGFSVLQSHPSLEKVNICVKMVRFEVDARVFDEEFYQNLTKLRRKLRSFRLTVWLYANHPIVENRFKDLIKIIIPNVSEVIIPNGKSNKLFACEKHYEAW